MPMMCEYLPPLYIHFAVFSDLLSVVPVASSSVLMVTPSITSTAPSTSPTNSEGNMHVQVWYDNGTVTR